MKTPLRIVPAAPLTDADIIALLVQAKLELETEPKPAPRRPALLHLLKRL